MTKVEGLLLFYFQNGGIHCVNDSMSQSAILSLSVTNVYVKDEFHLISQFFWVIMYLLLASETRNGHKSTGFVVCYKKLNKKKKEMANTVLCFSSVTCFKDGTVADIDWSLQQPTVLNLHWAPCHGSSSQPLLDWQLPVNMVDRDEKTEHRRSRGPAWQQKIQYQGGVLDSLAPGTSRLSPSN